MEDSEKYCPECKQVLLVTRRSKTYCRKRCRAAAHIRRKAIALSGMSAEGLEKEMESIKTNTFHPSTTPPTNMETLLRKMLKEELALLHKQNPLPSEQEEKPLVSSQEQENKEISQQAQAPYQWVDSRFFAEIEEKVDNSDLLYYMQQADSHWNIEQEMLIDKALPYIRTLINSTLALSEPRYVPHAELKHLIKGYQVVLHSNTMSQVPEDFPYTPIIKKWHKGLIKISRENAKAEKVQVKLSVKNRQQALIMFEEMRYLEIPILPFSQLIDPFLEKIALEQETEKLKSSLSDKPYNKYREHYKRYGLLPP